MKLGPYFRLIKFRYHLSFILVVMGALLFATQPLFTLIKPLLVVYFSFNILLYSGLYTLNDIADIESDSRHPKKKYRPLPSKNVSVPSALALAFAGILAGLAVAYGYFGFNIFLVYVSFIFINQFYTRAAKKIPYLEIICNSLTHPMRFFLGVLLVAGTAPYLLLFAIFLFAFGIACNRRIIEKKSPGWEVRKVLRYYTQATLVFFQIAAFFLMVIISVVNYPFYGALYVMIMVVYIFLVFGIHVSEYMMNGYQWVFLN